MSRQNMNTAAINFEFLAEGNEEDDLQINLDRMTAIYLAGREPTQEDFAD